MAFMLPPPVPAASAPADLKHQSADNSNITTSTSISNSNSSSSSGNNNNNNECNNADWRTARSDAIAQAMVTLPVVCAVEARDGQYGGGIFAARRCEEGEVLLSIPLSACITSRDIPRDHPVLARIGSEESDSYGRSVIALLLALEAQAGTDSDEAKSSSDSSSRSSSGSGGGSSGLARYMRAVAPAFMLRWLAMAGWPEDSPPAMVVRGSVAWARAKAHQAAMRDEAASLGA
jgi:hypothetical protein